MMKSMGSGLCICLGAFGSSNRNLNLVGLNKKGDLLLTHVTRKSRSGSGFRYSVIQRFLMSSQIGLHFSDSLSSASSTGSFILKVAKWPQQFKASHMHTTLVQNKKELFHP